MPLRLRPRSEAGRSKVPIEGVEQLIGLNGPWERTQGIFIQLQIL